MSASFNPIREALRMPALSRRAMAAEIAGTRLIASAMVSTPGMLVSVATLVRRSENAVCATEVS